MRKAIMIAVISVLLSAVLCAEPAPDVSRTIYLQGAYDNVLSIGVTPIASQTGLYRYGMPFDIQDASVQYAMYRGRPIANWTCLANTPFRIKVEAEKLASVIDTGFTLDYILTFSYNLDYYVKGAPHTVSGTDFVYQTNAASAPFNSDEAIRKNGESGFIDADETALTGSVDGTIYFRFANGQVTTIDDDSLVPPGNYEARVKLILEAAE